MNNDNFLIEENDLIPAKEICKYIEDPEIRNRATANSTAALIAKKYFEDCDIDIATGLHNVAQVLEDIEISDIYINDNYIDVRLYFNDNELCVPKSHFERNILPVAYMFIKLNEDLTGGLVTGFITPNVIGTTNEINKYYPVNEEDLTSYYDIESFLIHKDPNNLPQELETKIFDYLDNKLEDTNAFYRELIDSRELRKKLIQAAKAKIVFNFVSIPELNSSEAGNEGFETNDSVDLIEESGDLELDIDMSAPDDFEDLTEIAGDNDEFQDIQELDSTLEESETEEDILLEEPVDILTDDNPVEEEIPLEQTFVLEDEDESEVSNENEIVPLEGFISDEESEKELPIEDYIPTNFNDNIEIEETIETQNNETLDEVSNDFTQQGNEFSTSITPSLESYEDLESITTEQSDVLSENKEPESEPENTETQEDNTPQIDTLFNNDNDSEEIEESFVAEPQKKKSLLLPILGTTVIIAAAGYFGYTQFMPAPPQSEELQDTSTAAIVNPEENIVKQESDAMPLESLDNTTKPVATNEGNTMSIPAIEQNLDASILVANLSVKWEVPAAYSNNATAKRYFTKMGKIIQLNLKTELLLLNKPPITNKIALELEYNKGANKFQVKGITASSGEKTVDEVITRTVKNALDMNLNMNMSSFGNIKGNPVLIISL